MDAVRRRRFRARTAELSPNDRTDSPPFLVDGHVARGDSEGITRHRATIGSRSDRVHSLLRVLLGTSAAPLPTDMVLIAVRTALAWIFIYYGAGKLFGSFGGLGLHGTAEFFSNTAHLHPGGLFAVLGGVIEFGGGIALALGVASRLAALSLFGDMVMAMITVTWVNGINSEKLPAGYELNMALAVMALVIVVFGAGRFSVDSVIERRVAMLEARRDG